MPKCNNCGNTEVFSHQVEGSETRWYNESGEVIEAEEVQMTSVHAECDRCGSTDITVS